jgi:hypothetical protein
MLRRRRPLLRAAAVGGTAYMAGRHLGRRAQEEEYAEASQDQRLADLEQQSAYQQQQAAYQQAPQVPAQAPPSMLDQLNQLGTLHSQGILTDEEFAAAKSKLLSS